MKKLIILSTITAFTFSSLAPTISIAQTNIPTYQRIANTSQRILENPLTIDSELEKLGINTNNINSNFLKDIAASGNRQRLNDEIRWLETNRERINNGTFNDPVYKGSKPSYNPVKFVKKEIISPVLAEEPKDVTRPYAPHSPFYYNPWVIGLGVVGVAGIGLALGGGGGGGGGSSPTPSSPPPSGDIDYGRSALPDIYTRTDFQTTEFSSFIGNALSVSKFDYAYAKGTAGLSTSGNAEKILMVHDWFPSSFSGNAELPSSRIIGSTLNPSGDSSYQGVSPHGLTVARKAAGEKNDSSYHGGAYQAKMYFYSTYNGFNINSGLNYAAGNSQIGVINMSYGLGSGNSDAITVYQNVANAGKLMLVATGNDAEDQPNYPAYHAKDLNGYMLAVAAVNSSGVLASYSNKCGDAMQWCVTAISGDGAQSDQGTSFSTPLVSAAATIIWNAWPSLEANEVADIIRQTADDLGTAGVDSTYGWGRINMQSAMDPVGSSSFVSPFGGQSNLGNSNSITNNSNPFGSNFSNAEIKILDSYGRDFTVKPTNYSANKRDLANELELFNFNSSIKKIEQKLSDKISLSFYDTDINSEYKISENSNFSLGYISDITRFNSEQKFNSKNFLKRNEFGNPFLNLFEGEAAINTSADYKYKNLKFSLSNLISQDQDNINYSENSAFTASILSSNFENKNFSLNFSNGFLTEENSALGQKTNGSYNFAKESKTIFSGISSSFNFKEWSLFGNYFYGKTSAKPDKNSAFISEEDIISNSASIALTKEDNFGDDNFSLSYSLPLSVEKGRLTGFYLDNQNQVNSYYTDISKAARNNRAQLSYENNLDKKTNLIITAFNETDSNQTNSPLLGLIGKVTIKW